MPANLDPDAALMLRVQQGDTAAFAELVEKYKQPVMNFACRTIRDATEAEDLAQNVFIQVYKSARRYRSSARFSTWLFTIARNLCLNEIRRRSRHPAESLDATQPGQEGQPQHQVEDRTAFPLRKACCGGSSRTRWTARWPSCPKTSARPSFSAGRRNSVTRRFPRCWAAPSRPLNH